MSPSPPSPSSTGPHQRNLVPNSAPEALDETTDDMKSRLIPAVPTQSLSPEEIIGRKLYVLAEFMRARPASASLVKVIAVDGSDRNAIRGMVAALQHRITRDLHYVVRVINENSFYAPSNQPTELSYFYRQIQSWGAVWEMILHAPTIPSDLSHPSNRATPASTLSGYPPSFNCPLVYIIPVSPLMATMQAMPRVAGAHDPWRLLSSYWQDSFRPDVTINIQDIADTHNRYEVLRFQIQGTNTLVVTKEGNAGLTITPQQMRRAVFEVEEWIRW